MVKTSSADVKKDLGHRCNILDIVKPIIRLREVDMDLTTPHSGHEGPESKKGQNNEWCRVFLSFSNLYADSYTILDL